MASEEENEISKVQRQLYLNHIVVYDTTLMFPPKPLPRDIKIITVNDVMNDIESHRKAHTADLVVSMTPTDSDLTLVSTKSRGVSPHVIILDSMSQYNE